MDRGYAGQPGAAPFVLTPQTTLQDIELAFGAFADVVIRDLIPAVDASYRTRPDREHRAMAGLSMGGMQTLFIASRHPDTFAWVASLSGPMIRGADPGEKFLASLGGPFDTRTACAGLFADPESLNRRLRLLWIGVGTEEQQLHAGISEAVEALRKSGVHVVYYESQGTAHEWQTWRRDLKELAPRLFR
jgi:enterochelin esterase family protein